MGRAVTRASAKLDAIIGRHGLRRRFGDEVVGEAKEWAAHPGIDDPALADLTHLPFVTIDNPDSRDLDQALFIEAAADGFVVWYALADASYYVRPGSALFDEALRRGASFYFPGFALPMLPRLLSEGLVSLNPRVERRALVFRMAVGGDAECTSAEVLRARIRSRAKLSYEGVQGFYDEPDESPIQGTPWARSLELLRDFGKVRIAAQEARNVVRYRRTEARVEVEGERVVAIGEARNDTEKYNEQLSLLCNIEGARLMAESSGDPNAQPVFRVHPSPPEGRLASLQRMLDDLVRLRGLDPSWRWRPGRETLADYVRRLPLEGPQGRLGRAVQQQALVINLRSTFTEEPGLHFGVGAEVYGRFTSPMREIVGVWTHKELLEQLELEPSQPPALDEAMRERVIQAANHSREVQRRITKEANMLAIDALLGDDLARPEAERPLREGTVMGVAKTRLYVQLDDPPLELKVYFADLQDASSCGVEGCHGDLGVRVAGGAQELLLGDPVALKTVDYDAKRRRYVLIPQGWLA